MIHNSPTNPFEHKSSVDQTTSFDKWVKAIYMTIDKQRRLVPDGSQPTPGGQAANLTELIEVQRRNFNSIVYINGIDVSSVIYGNEKMSFSLYPVRKDEYNLAKSSLANLVLLQRLSISENKNRIDDRFSEMKFPTRYNDRFAEQAAIGPYLSSLYNYIHKKRESKEQRLKRTEQQRAANSQALSGTAATASVKHIDINNVPKTLMLLGASYKNLMFTGDGGGTINQRAGSIHLLSSHKAFITQVHMLNELLQRHKVPPVTDFYIGDDPTSNTTYASGVNSARTVGVTFRQNSKIWSVMCGPNSVRIARLLGWSATRQNSWLASSLKGEKRKFKETE